MSEHHTHDSFYKGLFSYPVMVESFITTFLPEAIWKRMDFATLAPYESELHGERGEVRSEDRIWRVKLDGSDCYLMIMLEFQSKSDHWMAVRILAYTALLWQSLIRTSELKPGDKLPLVLPIVIYNGSKAWRAPLGIVELLPQMDKELERFQPVQEYYLLDEARVNAGTLTSLAGLLVRLEQADSATELARILEELGTRVSVDLLGLQRLIISWLSSNIFRHTAIDISGCSTLGEAHAMLVDVAPRWEEMFMEKGFKKGLELGRTEGLELGNLTGRRNALLDILQLRFGEEAVSRYAEALGNIADIDQLGELTRLAMQVPNLEDFEVQLGNTNR